MKRLLALGVIFLTATLSGCGREFPQIREWRSLRITLTRTFCFGTCPDYSVEVRGDGTMRYKGRYCVAVKGTRESRIPQEQVRKLFDAFEKADFFSLRDAYYGPFDVPTVRLALSFDVSRKEVMDGNGGSGLTSQAAKLPELIDHAANTARWIGHPKPFCT